MQDNSRAMELSLKNLVDAMDEDEVRRIPMLSVKIEALSGGGQEEQEEERPGQPEEDAMPMPSGPMRGTSDEFEQIVARKKRGEMSA